jgi:hypothetical protein
MWNLCLGRTKDESRLLVACLTVLILSGQVLTGQENQHSAVAPEHRHSWWTLRNDAVNERVKQGNVDLLLIGDSITHSWENAGRKYWDQYYAPRNAVNMGRGRRTQSGGTHGRETQGIIPSESCPHTRSVLAEFQREQPCCWWELMFLLEQVGFSVSDIRDFSYLFFA